jgi:hypothetical protein
MKQILALFLVLSSATAFAQTNPPAQGTAQGTPQATPPAEGSPPTVGGKPLVQVKPKRAPKGAAPAAAHQSIAKRLQACLEIDDGTKGRLDCYDAIFPPKPNPKAPAAKGVADCHSTKEEDERLNCYNGFAEKIPKF